MRWVARIFLISDGDQREVRPTVDCRFVHVKEAWYIYVLLEGFLGKSDVARGERASGWFRLAPASESAAGRDNRSAHRTRQVRRDLEFCQSPSGRLPRVTLGGGMFFIPVSSHHTNMAHTQEADL